MGDKETIRRRGEDTAYSAKGHFKSADFYKSTMKWLISINILFAVFSIADLGDSDIVNIITRVLGAVSLMASILILVRQSEDGKNITQRHMEIGEEYLDIHHQLQALYNQETVSKEEFEKVKLRLSRITKKSKPIINQLAIKMARRAIEKKGEMTTWWIEEQENKQEPCSTQQTK